ncbi:hypothetical protein KI688_000743 [Linnemannia hyalina]|uniref:Uncharacterized protein n=1 Tax=Linnemannia hyalina TaxID=64524 RepID=A0A9P7Y577_9FUNG|nr:hypothetical protein KI688_000743 [Linnemannia hyalina]
MLTTRVLEIPETLTNRSTLILVLWHAYNSVGMEYVPQEVIARYSPHFRIVYVLDCNPGDLHCTKFVELHLILHWDRSSTTNNTLDPEDFAGLKNIEHLGITDYGASVNKVGLSSRLIKDAFGSGPGKLVTLCLALFEAGPRLISVILLNGLTMENLKITYIARAINTDKILAVLCGCSQLKGGSDIDILHKLRSKPWSCTGLARFELHIPGDQSGGTRNGATGEAEDEDWVGFDVASLISRTYGWRLHPQKSNYQRVCSSLWNKDCMRRLFKLSSITGTGAGPSSASPAVRTIPSVQRDVPALVSGIINTLSPVGQQFTLSPLVMEQSRMACLSYHSKTIEDLSADPQKSLYPDPDDPASMSVESLQRFVYESLLQCLGLHPTRAAKEKYLVLKIVSQLLHWLETDIFAAPLSEQVFVSAWSDVLNTLFAHSGLRGIPGELGSRASRESFSLTENVFGGKTATSISSRKVDMTIRVFVDKSWADEICVFEFKPQVSDHVYQVQQGESVRLNTAILLALEEKGLDITQWHPIIAETLALTFDFYSLRRYGDVIGAGRSTQENAHMALPLVTSNPTLNLYTCDMVTVVIHTPGLLPNKHASSGGLYHPYIRNIPRSIENLCSPTDNIEHHGITTSESNDPSVPQA